MLYSAEMSFKNEDKVNILNQIKTETFYANSFIPIQNNKLNSSCRNAVSWKQDNACGNEKQYMHKYGINSNHICCIHNN